VKKLRTLGIEDPAKQNREARTSNQDLVAVFSGNMAIKEAPHISGELNS